MYTYLRICAAVIIGLHLISPYIEIEHIWGAGGFPFIPLLVRLALAAGAASLFWPRLATRAWALGLQALRSLRRHVSGALLAGTASLLALPVFWVARLQHLHWGDAYIFANAISYPGVYLTYSWMAPLDLYLHAKAWLLMHNLAGWDVQTTYAAISVLTGGIFVFSLLHAIDEWGDDLSQRAGTAALALTLGSMQLFFGYVEAYTILPLGILLFLWLGLRFLRGKGELWPASLALALGLGLSPSLFPLPLALLFLAWWAWRRRGWSVGRVALQVAGPMLIVGLAVVALMTAGHHGLDVFFSGADSPGGDKGFAFVPLTMVASKWVHYTMFSWAHLRDILNEQMLIAPLSLLLVVGVLLGLSRRVNWRDPALVFLAIAAASQFLLACTWNADYGGRRDWDLFASAALPMTLLAAYLLNRYVERPERERTYALAVAVSLMHLIPWIYFNTLPWPWT